MAENGSFGKGLQHILEGLTHVSVLSPSGAVSQRDSLFVGIPASEAGSDTEQTADYTDPTPEG